MSFKESRQYQLAVSSFKFQKEIGYEKYCDGINDINEVANPHPLRLSITYLVE
jgi:hypothetical protein